MPKNNDKKMITLYIDQKDYIRAASVAANMGIGICPYARMKFLSGLKRDVLGLERKGISSDGPQTTLPFAAAD